MTPEQAAALRAPFPPEAVGKLPKAGTWLEYVGHAAVCDRLLQVDPEWTWQPPTADELSRLPTGDGMWIKLTVCGVSRFGWGDGKNIKEWISDAIRNAAMRFGVALDLWSKEDLHAADLSAGGAVAGSDSRASEPATPKHARDKLKARCVALTADGVSVADEREARGLPIVDSCNEVEFAEFEMMVTELERELAKPFKKADA